MLNFGPRAHVSGLKDVNICVLGFCTSLDMSLIWPTDDGINIKNFMLDTMLKEK